VANPTERFAKTGGKALETNEQKMDMADEAGFEPSVPRDTIEISTGAHAYLLDSPSTVKSANEN
jgi:hypothetical protein